MAAGTAQPISDDIPMLIRTLGATTAWRCPATRRSWGPTATPRGVVGILEQLWLSSLWGGAAR